MNLYKYHALGNDYIVIDPRESEVLLTPGNIRAICHRHTGFGSDGILYGPFRDDGELALRIFNPDGSEAEKSGNGLRIFTRYLFDKGDIGSDRVKILTHGGEVSVQVYAPNDIEVEMGIPEFVPEKIPVRSNRNSFLEQKIETDEGNFSASCVSMGNPHCVIFTDDPTPEIAKKIGPLVETHDLFPNRTNVQFAQVVDDSHIRLEIWERGAGYTMASGSSSCAAVAVAHKLGKVSNSVNVQMPGGELKIQIMETGLAVMRGAVSKVGVFQSDEEFEQLLDQPGS